jgi:5-methyltetrahydropteroyltriglutamate--homocysteine methyltransferase
MSIRTTVVGSWWPYADEAEDLRRVHRGELTGEAADAVLDRCAARAIREQRELGFDEWTGGEYFTEEFIVHLQKRLTGVEVDVPPREQEYDYDDLGHMVIRGEIGCPDGLGYAQAYARERKLDGGVPKATVVGPFEVIVSALDQPEAVQREFSNVIGIVNREIRDLVAAGCPHVQLDVPVIGSMVNEGRLTAARGAEIIAACFEDVDGVRKGVHLCNGNNRGRPISSVLRAAPWVEIFQRLDGVVDVAALELSYFSEHLEREAFKDLPASIELAAGIVDEANYWPMPVEKIVERAADWARVVGEERLWLSPTCGFGRHPADDADQALLRRKCENLNEAAGRL